ncbi:MAG: site-specific integrase [Saccharospirillaceae bacterium]|nr:site-specific integrase [Saccharospirillaceae bacterium]MCD8532175.1 site-specific integrase [Saccharospirillaceae bacterium]
MANAKQYGSAERAERRKKGETRIASVVRAEIDEQIRSRIPELVQPAPNPEKADTQLQEWISELRRNATEVRRLRLAYRYLTQKISEINTQQQWNLTLPPSVIRLKRPNPVRTLNNLALGRAVGGAYQDWHAYMLSRQTYKKVSHDEALADVLISAAIHGALAMPGALVALANTIIMGQRFIGRHGDHIWIDLVWKPDTEPENLPQVTPDGTEYLTIRRFYPDTLTLGLIHITTGIVKTRHETLNEDIAWKLILNRLESVSPNQRFAEIKSLKGFAAGALATTETLDDVELPQALIEVACGNLESSSLRPEHQMLWMQNLPAQSSMQPISFFSGSFSHSSVSKTRKRERSIDGYIRSIDHALRPKDRGVKRGKNAALAELNEILSAETDDNFRIFTQWLIDSQDRLVVSSLKRYFEEIKFVWFLNTYDQVLEDLTEEEWIDLYEKMAETKDDPKARNYLLGRLKSLHEFLEKAINAPNLNRFFADTTSTKVRNRIRTGLISNQAFAGMLERLDCITDLDQHTIDGLKVLLILAIRTGMRRGELLKLRMKDVENSADRWIFVRENRYGSNKTYSALRRIPTRILLVGGEFEQFQRYLSARISRNDGNKNILLFSMPTTPSMQFDGNRISDLVKRLLVAQGLQDLSFHHLRHTAITNLMLVLEGNPQLIEQLTPYSTAMALLIRKAIYSLNEDINRDRYWSLSALVGHLTPEVTFSNYIHVADLIIGERVRSYNPTLTLTAAQSFTGLMTTQMVAVDRDQSKHSEVPTVKKAQQERYPINRQRERLINRLKKHIREFDPIHGQIAETESSSGEKIVQKKNYSVEDCYTALKKLEEGKSIPFVAMMQKIDEGTLERWLQNAQLLQAIKTRNNKERLFPERRKNTVFNLPLLPGKPADSGVAQEIDCFIGNLRDLYLSDREGFQWMLKYWLAVVNTAHSGIRFTKYEDLQQFRKTLDTVIKMNRWRLELYLADGDQKELGKWKSVIPHVILREDKTKASTFGMLHLSHPREAELLENINNGGENYQKYSSSVLRYLFHMLAIMVGIVPSK